MFRSPKVLVILLTIAVTLVVSQVRNPSKKVTVSKETTFITEPLAEDGLPDFATYFLQKGFEGVTPENNAAVLLWQAFWPEGLAVEYREPMRDALGLDPDIGNDPVLVRLADRDLTKRVADWLEEEIPNPGKDADGGELQQDLQEVDWESLAKEVIQLAQVRPWTSDQLPPLADWVEENQTQIGWIREASERPRLYSPSPNFLDDKPRQFTLLTALLPLTEQLRHACRALNAEAMWHLGEGHIDEAWQNTMACFRLAELVGQGWHTIHRLVAFAIEGLACRQAAVVMHHGELAAAEARQVLQQLEQLPALEPMVSAFDQGERVTYIDIVVGCASGRDAELDGFEKSSRFIDWNFVLREGNNFFDRMVSAAQIAHRPERSRVIQELEREVDTRAQGAGKFRSIVYAVLSNRNRSQVMSDQLLSLVTPSLSSSLHAEDRALALRDLAKVAAALAVYRAEQGEYPETLEQLVPDVLPEMPIDLYSDEPLIYRKMEDGGYLLYSISQNGIDNGGTDVGGEIVAGEWVEEGMDVNLDEADLVLRVPIPAFELPKPRGEE